MADPNELLPLTPLSFHLLLALCAGDNHGYGLMKEVRTRSDGRVNPATGTVYLALQRLEQAGLVGDAGLEEPVDGRARRRSWRITSFGRTVAQAESQRLLGLVGLAVDRRLVSREGIESLVNRPAGG